MVRISAVLLTAILLFGCGGDEKSKAPAAMTGNGSDTGVVLDERAALSISNSYLRVQAAPGLPPAELTLESQCDGQSCTITEPRTGISESVSLQELQSTDTDSIENLRQVVHFSLTKRDVAVYGGSVGFELGEGSSVHATAYGGWMVYNYFLAAWGDYSDTTYPSAQVGVGLSIGNATGTHPAVDATYNGVMLGVDHGGRRYSGGRRGRRCNA